MNNNYLNYVPQGVAVEHHNNVAVFEVAAADIQEYARQLYVDRHLPLKLIDATDERADGEGFKIWYVFGVPGENKYLAAFIRLDKAEEFASLTSIIHEAGAYEQKIHALFGLKPVGHPDSRRTILHENWPVGVFPLRKDVDGSKRPKTATDSAAYEFQVVDGEGIYEIPVGPIHAGIIEPGHFRFSVAGEEIVLLEPRLGYVHKGTEKLFESLSLDDAVRLSEKISGDSSFSHSLAFCQAVEDLAGITPPERATYLRVIYSELERLANHFNDIGFIMLDTGFNFGGAQGSRLREQVMVLNDRLTGSRFLRGVNTVGGVTKDILRQGWFDLPREPRLAKDFSELIEIAESSISLLGRLRGAGVLGLQVAKDHGTVGVAARALGIEVDARVYFPYAAYGELPPIAIALEYGGDVYARFRVRVKEVISSFELIRTAMKQMPEGAISARPAEVRLTKNTVAIGSVEGWRGEIVQFVKTDSKGRICRVAVRDPSFVNWRVVPFSVIGEMVPDFPLINKSYNMSYSGNDL